MRGTSSRFHTSVDRARSPFHDLQGHPYRSRSPIPLSTWSSIRCCARFSHFIIFMAINMMLCKIQRVKKKRRSRGDDGGSICLSHLLSAPDAGLGSESDAQRRAHLKATLGVLPEVVVQLPGKHDARRTKRVKQRRRRGKKGGEGIKETVSYPKVIQRLSNGYLTALICMSSSTTHHSHVHERRTAVQTPPPPSFENKAKRKGGNMGSRRRRRSSRNRLHMYHPAVMQWPML